MKMKKILAGVLAGAMTVSAVTVTSLTLNAAEEYIDVTVNVAHDYLSAIVFTSNEKTYLVNDNEVTVTGYWKQVDRQTKDQDNEYTAAFGNSSVDGSKQAFTFKASARDKEVALKTVMWSNTAKTNVAHEVVINLEEASDNKLNVQLIPDGEVGTEQQNNWYYLQNAKLNYIVEEVFDDDPGTETLLKDKDITWSRKLEGSSDNKYWNNDKSLSLSYISFENLGDFVQNGEIIAEWDSVMVTKAGSNDEITDSCQFTIKINCKKTDGSPCYEGIGGYSGIEGLASKTFTLNGTNIANYGTDDTKAPYTDVTFTYGVEPTGEYTKTAELDDEINVTITGLTIKAKTKKDIPAEAIKLSSTEESLYVGETVTLTATVRPSGTTDNIEWASNAEAIATVDENGVVTAISEGEATIKAKVNSEVSASCTITVSARPVETVSLNKTTLSLKKGETATLEATVLPANATDKTVTWETDDAEVATVKNDGTVIAEGKGTAVITATAGGKSAKCTVTVTVPAESVTLDQTTLSLFTGKSATLTATVKPDDTTDKVEWSSGDPTVATIEEKADGTCEVTAVGAGTAVITATAGEAEAAKCTVTVKDPAKEIILDDISILTGEEQDITYTTDPAKATLSNIEYATSDPTVFTVTDGKVKGVGAGSATLTMTATNEVGTELKKTCTVTVSDEAIAATAITLTDTAIELEVEGTKILTATLTPADSTDKITWTSSDATVASVDKTTGATVTVTALKEGTATITAAANETVKATCTVTVTAKTIVVESVTLTPTAATVEEGKTVELTATVKPDNAADKTVTWTTSDPAVATVENGVVTAVKEGTATITATAGKKSATCKITVTKKVIAIESVTLDKETATVEEGETVELTATVNPENTTEDKTVTWSTSNEKIATVENGKVTAVKAGEATITATAGGKSAECKITVTAKKADDPKPDDPKPDDPKPDDPKPDEDNINISFVDEPYELEIVDATGWSNGEYNHAAQVNIKIQISGITYGTTTFGEIKNKTITLNNIVYKSCGIEGVEASDIEVCIYMLHGKDAWEWVGSEAGSMEDTTITWDLSTLAAARAVVPDSSPIQTIGYQINIKGSDVEAIEAMEIGETVEVNGENDNPPTPPEETTTEKPTPAPSVPEGSFTVPTTSGSSSGDNTAETTTAAPAPAESEQAAPSSTEEDTSTNTTSPLATKDGGDDVQPTESGTPIPDGGNGDAGNAGEDSADVGNAGAGNAEDKNAATGVTLALIPMIAAAAGVVISKKRK